ncbi:MAG TPA: hypothetical protein VKV15_07795 [Bryobacteraceae bacterium]|nr:hypothetical protein [Bryobacteraceae bacterium]
MHLFKWRRNNVAEAMEGNQPAWKPLPDFSQAVDDALRLLVYAAETGRNVDDTTRNSILHAKAAAGAGWDETVSANLLAALTQLAADLYPITPESLDASAGKLTKPTITILKWWALILAVPIVLFSVLGFVSSSISNAIRADIKSCNDLVVKLRGELGTEAAPKAGTPEKPFPPSLNEGDVITQLQLYASTIRAIDARSRQLNWLVFNVERDPFADLRWDSKESKKQREAGRQGTAAGGNNEQKIDPDCAQTIEAMTDNECKLKAMFQLPVGLPNMPKALDTLTTTYQGVRSFGQDVLDLVSVSYGAITTCLLPILYALLGTCAYLLRCFEEQLRTLTFMPSSRANWARFLIAGIGGAVVGLFGNFSITDGASISPLAIAFLVGYAVDVFFSFLENLLKSFTKPKNGVAAEGAAAYQKQKAPAHV